MSEEESRNTFQRAHAAEPMMKLLVLMLALIGSTLGEPIGTRVVGGSAAAIGQYPFMGVVQQLFDEVWWEYTCGGTLLTRAIVLSSARYFGRGGSPWLWRVRLGSNMASGGGSVHAVSEIIRHPEFDNFHNDVSIIRLAVPAVYSSTVQPARIAGPNSVIPDGTMVHVAGWGPNMARAPSEILLRADMAVVNQEVCRSHYASSTSYPNITDSMICTGAENVGTCASDSGGPVVLGSDVIVGVISFSENCGYGDVPSVHSRVTYYANWIASFS